MINNFEHFQKLGKENAEATVASFGAVSKGFQKIAVELADYSKKVFDEGTAAAEKLLGVKSLDKAIEVQSDYVKSAYEGFVSQSTKLGEIYSEKVLWQCTTCGACENQCPVGIEHIPLIIGARRGLVSNGAAPESLGVVYNNLERRSNIWGLGYDQRSKFV